jgi:hypothetical protein
MNPSLLRKEILPFLLLFGALILGAVVIDALLHALDLVWVGRYLGIPGTLLILTSFLYSMRKRKLIHSGKPRTLLRLHETLAWTGALMILVHAGIHVYAILPWLALVAMMVNIISGMTGKVLLERSRRFLAEKREGYLAQGMTEAEIERQMFWDATAFDLMKRWRAIHLPITLAFGVLALAHILTIFLFWQWS